MRTIDGDQHAQAGERSCDWRTALSNGERAVRRFGWTAELDPLGDDPALWRCVLHNGNGEPVPSGAGSGKGYRLPAQVGAIFEALEHHFGREQHKTPDIVLRPAREAATELTGDVVGARLAEGPDEPIACLPFRNLPDDAATLLPVFLTSPDYVSDAFEPERRELGDTYDYAGVLRYSLNSGCAAGSTREEATVHAINEIVERDAFSLMLINTFLAASSAPLTVVDPATLPDNLAELHGIAQQRSGGSVQLIDMTTSLGIPAVLAYLPPQPGEPARVRGAGASLSREHAIRRALTELLQLMAGSTQRGDEDEERDWTAEYPPFHDCYLMNLGPKLLEAEVVAYAPTAAPGSPGGHLERLVRILTSHGFTPLVRELHTSAELTVVSTVVPGLERFMVITDGQLVVPGPRGLAARP